jgi:hypothetical protein
MLRKMSGGKRLSGRAQRGIAAVEFAVILPVLITMLAFPVFFGRVFLHYTVAQKAAHDAAIYLSNISMIDMGDTNRARAAADVAQGIVDTEIAHLEPGHEGRADVQVQCDGGPCGNDRPSEITVHVRMRVYDDFFKVFTDPVVGDHGVYLKSQFSATYVGSY